MTRDDLDRLLVAGGLAWLWFVTPLALGSLGLLGAGEPSPGLVAYAVSLPVLLLLAALALWRNRPGARLPLAGAALLAAAGAVVLVENRAAAAVIAAGSLVVALGAARLRIPPPEVPAARAGGYSVTPAGARRPAPAQTEDPELLAFLDAAAHLDRERARVLSAAWRAEDAEQRRAAWTAVRREAGLTNRTGTLDGLRREIELWGRAAGGSPWTWEWATMTDVDRSDVRRSAMPALLDAAAAVLLRDRLDAETREILLAPWESAMAMPPPEDFLTQPTQT